MKIEAIKHKDIRDKEQKYLKVTNSAGGMVIINIGEKNYNAIVSLIEIEKKQGGK